MQEINKLLAMSALGLAALLLTGPASSAELQCKAFNDAFNDHAQHKANRDKYAALMVSLVNKSVDELDAGKRNEVRKVVSKIWDEEEEPYIFSASIDQFCLTAGNDGPLRDAVLKSVHQYQERHRR